MLVNCVSFFSTTFPVNFHVRENTQVRSKTNVQSYVCCLLWLEETCLYVIYLLYKCCFRWQLLCSSRWDPGPPPPRSTSGWGCHETGRGWPPLPAREGECQTGYWTWFLKSIYSFHNLTLSVPLHTKKAGSLALSEDHESGISRFRKRKKIRLNFSKSATKLKCKQRPCA